ncbi:hypothetical protein GWQ43_19820 (plasmid) [Alcaligenes faecalis]|uniref:hypothetical protein n=1 Tax=Alcaligenes faecalis TaxID=511 RepID=UPI000F68026D|nr:hypothetical protein [Alcaligenes faecalis]QHS38418.1 hypothetical protein GWQ43_19820 [Alcaligenes faecalis]RSE57607.1 hypothetical protein EGT81_19415 [Alcaligenes faecalis]
MTDDFKAPMYGPTFLFDLSNHEPRSGKSTMMNQLLSELAGKVQVAETIITNCTTTIPRTFDFDAVDTRHTVVLGPYRKVSK